MFGKKEDIDRYTIPVLGTFTLRIFSHTGINPKPEFMLPVQVQCTKCRFPSLADQGVLLQKPLPSNTHYVTYTVPFYLYTVFGSV